MRRIAVFQHADGEGPGTFGTLCAARGIALEVTHVPRAGLDDAAADAADGLLVLGGPMSVNDPDAWIARETAAVRRALAAGRPVLGICLGAQFVAKAAGARVYPHRVPEIGWFPVTRVPATGAHAWLGGLPAQFEAFHWHGETFDLPAGAEHLWASTACAHQGFALGRALALQCHVEMDAAMVRDWSAAATGAAPTVQSPAAMAERLEARCAALAGVAATLLGAWLNTT